MSDTEKRRLVELWQGPSCAVDRRHIYGDLQHPARDRYRQGVRYGRQRDTLLLVQRKLWRRARASVGCAAGVTPRHYDSRSSLVRGVAGHPAGSMPKSCGQAAMNAISPASRHLCGYVLQMASASRGYFPTGTRMTQPRGGSSFGGAARGLDSWPCSKSRYGKASICSGPVLATGRYRNFLRSMRPPMERRNSKRQVAPLGR